MKKSGKKSSYKTGLLAENIASLLLTCKCYRILARRYKTKMGEVDIIALRGKTLIFIEVKNRTSRQAALESINRKQQKRIINAAEFFLSNNRQFTNHKKRFDAIAIAPNLFPAHIKNAWDS